MTVFKRRKRIVLSLIMTAILFCAIPLGGIAGSNLFAVKSAAQGSSETSYSSMLSRAEAVVNYEWVPQQRIYTWNENPYNGKMYFEAGETVKGVPYTLFSWELGFDSLLSLNQYKTKASTNYSTEKYCNSVSANRTGPAYGNCCATFVSEVFGGNFMNGSNPRYDGVGGIMNSTYSNTFTKVKAKNLLPGDSVSSSSGSHIIWIGDVNDEEITIYESTPPISQKTVLIIDEHTDSNGYLLYGSNVYSTVSKSNEYIWDGLNGYELTDRVNLPIKAYSLSTEKTLVYDSINGNTLVNKIYSTDECIIDAVYTNGWCHVIFPLDAGGFDSGYVMSSVFFDDNYDITSKTVRSNIFLYSRENLSEQIGNIISNSEISIIGDSENAFQVLCHMSSGENRVGWVNKLDIDKESQEHWMNELCPIKGFPCVTENFEVKKSDYSTRGGEIYTSDYCTINYVYDDGWCQVTFPLNAGGRLTAYTPLSNFVYDVDYSYFSYSTTDRIDVYTRKDLSENLSWWIDSNDTFYVVGEYENSFQVLYSIAEDYGGGYKLGWVSKDSLTDIGGEPTLSSISILTQPTKQEYEIGESLDTTGLQIELTYSDNSTETISSGFTVNGFNSETAGTKQVTVTYSGKTAKFNVTVKADLPDENDAQFIVESKTAKSADTITVEISIKNNPGIIGLRLNISYDSDVLALQSTTLKDFVGVSFGPTANNPFIVSWSDALHGNMCDDGVIAELTFKVNESAEEGTTSITVSYDSDDVFNSSWDNVYFVTVDGTIRIINYIPGDVNGDSKVNMKDYALLQQYLNGWDVTIVLAAADVNADDKQNLKDLALLQQFLNGWDVILR